MRFLLRDGSREVLVFTRTRFASFRDLEHAAEALLRYVDDPKNLDALRNLLAEDPDYAHVAHTDPVALVTRVAHMVTSGRLQVLPHPDALPPWSWPFPSTPTHPVFAAESEAELNPLSALAEALEEAVDDRLDVVPDAIIPPEFPRMAKREAEAMLMEAKQYGWAIDMMRFFGQKKAGEHDIPQALVDMAVKTGGRMKDEVQAAGGILKPLAQGGMPALDGSSLGAQLNAMAKQGGTALKEGAQKTGEVLLALAVGAAKDAGLTKVGPVFKDLANTQTQQIAESAKGAGGQFIQLVAGKAGIPNPAAIPAQLVQMAGKNAGAIAAAASLAGKGLTALNEGQAPAPGKAILAPQLLQMGASNAQQLQAAAAGTAPALNGLKPTADELALQPPKIGATEFGFTMLGDDNAPMAGVSWRVTLADGRVLTGSTDGNGRAKIDKLAVGSKGTLELPNFKRVWRDTAGTLPGPTIHIVQKGDWLSKIAQKYGFKDWKEIYTHPENEAFRTERPDPNLIQPGDRIFIPEKAPRKLTFKAGQSVTIYPVGHPAAKPATPAAPQGQQAQQPAAPKPGPYVPPGPYQSPNEQKPPPVIKPAPKPTGKEVILVDETGMLCKVPKSAFEEMLEAHGKLEGVRAKIVAAKSNASAHEAALKELQTLCGAKSVEAAGVHKISEIAPVDRAIRQLIEPRTKRIVYIPQKRMQELEKKYAGKFSRERLKDVIVINRKGAAATYGEQQQQAEDDAKTKGKSKLGNLNLEVKYKLTDWEETLQGEGSLLDIFNGGDSSQLRCALAHPNHAPSELLEALRKKHGTKENWLNDPNNPVMSSSWEATFLRWSYGIEDIAIAWEPGKVKIGGKASGSISLASAKGEVAFDLPSKEGAALPVPTKDGSKFLVRVHIVGRVSGFVGATAELSCEANVPTFGLAKNAQAVATNKKSSTPLELGVQGGLKAFAGAAVTATGELGIEWFNLKESKWKGFGKVIGEATAIAGAAVELAWSLGWNSKTKTFTFEFKAKAALKLGGGAGVKFEVDANEILTFISELLARTDWAKIGEIAAEAFEAYVRFMIGTAISPYVALGTAIWNMGEAFMAWSGKQSEIHDLAENINSGKANSFLKSAPPEARAAVVAKLCERSMFLSDEAEEVAIMKVLESAPSRQALLLTLKKVDPSKNTIQAGIDKVDSSVDWAEQDRFDNLLKKYGLR